MAKIGYHISSAGGYPKAVERAVEKELEVFQLFLSSPRTWSYRDLKDNEVSKFKGLVEKHDYSDTTVHMNYLPNPSTPEDDTEMREKTLRAFMTEVERADMLEVEYLVFHQGSHKGKGYETAKPMVVDTILKALEKKPNVTLLLETSAGQKNSVGSSFEEIRGILDLIEEERGNLDKVGVCFDTCHVFAAGYDLSTRSAVKKTLNEFENIIGSELLKVVHANDSKGKLGQGKDRHAHIGDGYIGETGFKTLLEHDWLGSRPFILETPSDGVVNDIVKLKKWRPEE